MTKSVTKIQDKDTNKRLSVVRSTADPTKYWIVVLNPDGTPLSWPKGDPWDAATITVGTTTTWQPWTSASVTNSGTNSAAVLNFTIPEWEQWEIWPTGNGIESVTSSKVWKTTTVTMDFTDGSSPFSFQVEDGADWQWAWDVIWPNSSTDEDVVVFDWTTWKLIKDSWVKLSSKLDASALSDTNYWWAWNGDTTHTPTKNALYTKLHTMDVEIWNKAADNTVVKLSWNQTINWTKTFWTSPVVPSKTAAATNSGTAIATEAQVYNVANWLWTAASKNTWTSSWNVPVLDANGKLDTTVLPWVALTDTFTVTDKSDLTSLSTAEQWDIWIVTSESKTYVLSQAPYSTLANWKELLSPTDAVTSVNSKTGAVTLNADDISDSTTTNKFVTATDKSTWSGKQDALTLPATPTQWNLVVRWANNKTLADGWTVPTGVPSWWNNWDVLTNVSGTPTWAAPTGWVSMSTITVTLASANRSSKEITVSATGVTASNTVIVSPAPANINDYASNSVYCYSQSSWSLTFKCNTEPDVDIVVNVLILS